MSIEEIDIPIDSGKGPLIVCGQGKRSIDSGLITDFISADGAELAQAILMNVSRRRKKLIGCRRPPDVSGGGAYSGDDVGICIAELWGHDDTQAAARGR